MRRFSRLSAVGAPLLVPALRAYENSEGQIPALTDGAIKHLIRATSTWGQNEPVPTNSQAFAICSHRSLHTRSLGCISGPGVGL